ncbi:MAG: hypothetical protein GXO72_01555, partial [Caldiserica bacterium]|nr:hypothetical protein [Caldisericota bacterium]
LARKLFSWRAEVPRAVSPRLHLELEILAHCGAPPRPAPVKAGGGRGASGDPGRSDAGPDSGGVGTAEGPPETLALPGTGPAGLFGDAPGEEDKSGEGDSGRPESERPSPDEYGSPWDKLIAAALADRVSVAAFLLPADAEFHDGVLTLVYPQGYRFHYEMLREPGVRGYVEDLARRFFRPLLSVRIEYAGEEERKLSLEEGAELLARYLEGRVVREEG